MNKEKGILLIAAGHYNYGKMAAGLAATLRAAEPGVNIHLACTASAIETLSLEEKALFNTRDYIPYECYSRDENRAPEWIRTKLFMYQLSPYKETLFLDCDMAWIKKKPSDLFQELSSEANPITFMNNGETGFTIWGDSEQIKQSYGISSWVELHSELIFFRKTKLVKKFFSDAVRIFDKPKFETALFAGSVADEIAFIISAKLNNIVPHTLVYHPVFWKNRNKIMVENYLLEEKGFVARSMGGSRQDEFEITQYNNLISAAYLKLGLRYPYKWKQKYSFLASRQKL